MALEVRLVTTPSDLLAAVGLRVAVFVHEQGVPLAEEVDADDAEAYHLVALRGGVVVGTGRLVMDGNNARVGRMAVCASARGGGVGSALLAGLLAEARRRGVRQVTLAAQLHARPFYARFGFEAYGTEFLDAGIPHQRMNLDLTRLSTPTSE